MHESQFIINTVKASEANQKKFWKLFLHLYGQFLWEFCLNSVYLCDN